MKWEGAFRVPGAPAEVVLEFADARRMAAHFPGAEVEEVAEDGSLVGRLTVAFGPKRLVFRGKALCEADVAGLHGRITGQGASDMRAARFKVELHWRLRDDPSAGEPTTIVTLTSAATLQGVLADFARTGGPIVAAALTEEFAKRLERDLRERRDGRTPDHSAPAEALSAGRVAGTLARHAARQTGQSIARLFQPRRKN